MAEKLFGIYSGVIVKRDDPMFLSRVKVSVPGIIEPDGDNDGPWAFPRGGGSPQYGKNSVPPNGGDVLVQFVNGDINKPLWEPAWHGIPIVDGQQKSEAFPEHDSPDVHVFGVGPFRVIVDDRDGQRSATLKIVKEVSGEERTVASLDFNYEDNSAILSCASALGLQSGAIIDIDAPTIQVLGRKITPSSKPIN